MHVEFAPPEELQDTIRCFWYDRQDYGGQPTAFEVLPDGYAEIIFHFGGNCSRQVEGVRQPLPSPFLMGLLNQPAVFYAEGRQEIIAIRCFPWTVFDLLGLPSGKGIHELAHPVARLHPALETLVLADRVDEAILLLRRYFLVVRSQLAMDSMLAKAGKAMRQANGTLPVGQVAASAHATVRTLERNFRQSSGHTVKDVSAVMRFERVRNHLWLYPEANLAGLAAEAGYTDQSHLSREFKRYSGLTPGAFARKARQRKEALAADFVAFVQA